MAYVKRKQRLFVLSLVCAMTLLACSVDDRPLIGHQEPVAPGGPPRIPGAMRGIDPMPAAAADAGGEEPTAPVAATSSSDAGGSSGMTFESADAATVVAPGERPDAALGEPMQGCIAGTYTGDFDCALDPATLLAPAVAPSPPPTAVTSITFTLDRSSAAGRLEFSGASIVFPYAGFLATASVAGELDCGAGAFHADIRDGAYLSWLGVPIVLPFTGAIEGRLDRNTGRLSGSWWHAPSGGGSCVGTWTARGLP